jgi:transcription initiation factor TFIID subunit TAF12
MRLGKADATRISIHKVKTGASSKEVQTSIGSPKVVNANPDQMDAKYVPHFLLS